MLGELFSYFLGTFTTLFSVVNPLGMVPVFLALTVTDTPAWRATLARKASIYMVAILSFFLFAGTFIMDFFGISLVSLRVAGGIIVLRSGFLLLNSTDKSQSISEDSAAEARITTDISLSPLAMPMLSGPGSIAAVIGMATRRVDFALDTGIKDKWIALAIIFLSIVVIGVLCFLIMRASQRILPLLGRSGLDAVSKIMGFITMTVGVQFIMNGMQVYLKKIF